MKKCIKCYKEIEEQASKCNLCGSHQGIFCRVFDFYPFTTLGIALVSLLVSGLTYFNNHYGYSDLKFSLGNDGYYDFDDGKKHYLVFVTNNGNRPAALVKAELISELGATKGFVRSNNMDELELTDNLSSRFISGGDKIAWYLKFKSEYAGSLSWPDVMNSKLNIYVKRCKLRLTYENFKGEKENKELTIYDEEKDKFDSSIYDDSFSKDDRMNAQIKYMNQYGSCKIGLYKSMWFADHKKNSKDQQKEKK